MLENGWNIDVSYSNGNDGYYWQSNPNEQACNTETFYGYRSGNTFGSVAATFKGWGIGTLSYGNCDNTGFVLVSLNGTEIGRSTANSQDLVNFRYGSGDVLKIEEIDDAIIKLYSLYLQDAG